MPETFLFWHCTWTGSDKSVLMISIGRVIIRASKRIQNGGFKRSKFEEYIQNSQYSWSMRNKSIIRFSMKTDRSGTHIHLVLSNVGCKRVPILILSLILNTYTFLHDYILVVKIIQIKKIKNTFLKVKMTILCEIRLPLTASDRLPLKRIELYLENVFWGSESDRLNEENNRAGLTVFYWQ